MVLYDPFNKMKAQAPQGKQTVKALMDFGVNKNQYFTQQQYVHGQLMHDMYNSEGNRGRPIRAIVGV